MDDRLRAVSEHSSRRFGVGRDRLAIAQRRARLGSTGHNRDVADDDDRVDWVVVQAPDQPAAVSVMHAFEAVESGWGERGLAIHPDRVEYRIASRMAGRSLDQVLLIVDAWLKDGPVESVVVVGDGVRYVLRRDEERPRADEPRSDELAPPTGDHLVATLKAEVETAAGEIAGPLWVWDTVGQRVVWSSAEWMRESDARALCHRHGWQFDIDC